MENKKDNVIPMPNLEHHIPDYAISNHINNLFATYGEDYVRHTIYYMFGIQINEKDKETATGR